MFARSGSLLSLAFPALLVLLLVGCGSSGSSSSAPPTPATPPTIHTQPASQTVPLASSATFTVDADGSVPLTYQWSRSGTPIAGATSDTYTMASVSLADADASFTVVVSNTAGTATSNPAKLTIGPRSPQAGDLRFKGVDFAPSLNAITYADFTGNSSLYQPNVFGSPIEVGTMGACGSDPVPYDCAWRYALFALPAGTTGIDAHYAPDVLENLKPDLQSLNKPNTIISALDEEPTNDVFAASFLETSQVTGFSSTLTSIDPTALQAAIAAEAAQGHVITALSTNAAGQVDFVSTAWASETHSYDAEAVFATFSDVESQAATLAAAGYIITAVGDSTNGGFILIGTRVHGDTLPRPFAVNEDFSVGYAPVGWVFDVNGNTILGEQ